MVITILKETFDEMVKEALIEKGAGQLAQQLEYERKSKLPEE